MKEQMKLLYSGLTSALKMLKQNVLTHDQAFSASAIDKNNVTELSADLGLQLVNHLIKWK